MQINIFHELQLKCLWYSEGLLKGPLPSYLHLPVIQNDIRVGVFK